MKTNVYHWTVIILAVFLMLACLSGCSQNANQTKQETQTPVDVEETEKAPAPVIEKQPIRDTTPRAALSTIACGYDCSYAIREDHSLWGWGKPIFPGVGTLKVPTQLMDDVSAISCGSFHFAVLKTDHSLWLYGDNSAGQLGNGKKQEGLKNREEDFVKIMDNVIAVSCGKRHTAAIQSDGSLWVWGQNSSGQVGNSGEGNDSYLNEMKEEITIQTVPVKVLDGVAVVSCGGSHTMAITEDGTLWAWGSNDLGQFGDGGTESSSTPIKIMDHVVSVSTVPGIAFSNESSCGGSLILKDDGTVIKSGQLATDGGPEFVMEGVSSCIGGKGGFYSLVQENGSLWTWGPNLYGQKGYYDPDEKPTVSHYKSMDTGVIGASCGLDHMMAVLDDGTLWAWGDNTDGQIGTNGGYNQVITRYSKANYCQTSPVQIMDGILIP